MDYKLLGRWWDGNGALGKSDWNLAQEKKGGTPDPNVTHKSGSFVYTLYLRPFGMKL